MTRRRLSYTFRRPRNSRYVHTLCVCAHVCAELDRVQGGLVWAHPPGDGRLCVFRSFLAAQGGSFADYHYMC